MLRKVILWECNVAICAIILFFVDCIVFRSMSDLLSFTRVKESRQRKHAPVKSLFFALFQFSQRQFAELATLKQTQIA
ncbi:hypothetical protein CN11_08890 [Haemophilus influenzae]|nr:hypothetical protein CN11_08890 [Haemophilus influenzae]